MCRHYRWDHDFWRRMGKNEFYLWVDQLHRETQQADTTGTWRGTESDPGWQKMREKRDRIRGR